MDIVKLFFQLLGITTGSRDCFEVTPTADEWAQMFGLAEKQTLMGVCAAGIEKLPQEQMPPYDLLMEWIGTSTYISQRNLSLNIRCNELQSQLLSKGLRSCILKGQGIARKYDEQVRLYRQSGDIDIWIEGGFERVFKLVQELCSIKDVDDHHFQLTLYDDVEIEAHYALGSLINRCRNRRFKKWYEGQRNAQMENRVSIGDDITIVCPDDSFNLVYLMAHMHRHFFTEGVGLRQFMDYYYALKNNNLTATEKQSVVRLVDVFGMSKFAASVMWVLKTVFELDSAYMLWEPNERIGCFVLNEVMRSGNFGKFDASFKREEGASHFKRFCQVGIYGFRFIRYFPSMSFWIPMNHLRKFWGNLIRKKQM